MNVSLKNIFYLKSRIFSFMSWLFLFHLDLNSLICGSGYGNSCFVDIEINVWSRLFLLHIYWMYLISRMVIVPSLRVLWSKTKSPNTNQRIQNSLQKTSEHSHEEKIKITVNQTPEAIKKAEWSTAFGPDEIYTIMLKHLGPHGIKHLTNLYNNVVDTVPSWGKD